MAKDVLTDSLTAACADHIKTGRWRVQAIAGGRALTKAKAFLSDFEIDPTDQTVIIICERQKGGA